MGEKENLMAFILRLTLGVVFLWAGAGKLIHPQPTIGWVTSMGIVPMDVALFVLLLALVEVALGILLIVGLFLRVAAAVTLAILGVFLVIVFVYGTKRPTNLALMGSALSLIITRAHAWSLDGLRGRV